MSTAGRLPGQSAALAGTRAGIQTTGPWSGRRQLLVRFAIEAETAQIYSANALRSELTRAAGRSRYHSIAIVGRDALADVEFLRAAFAEMSQLPVMLDHDGQRPTELEVLLPSLSLVQVTMDGEETSASIERACQTLAACALRGVAHSVTFLPTAKTSDGPLLRIVELVHAASADTQIVLHPPTAERAGEDDARWSQWLERAMAMHSDARVLPRWPAPQPAVMDQGRGTHNARNG
jgi:hypothetical protein